MSIFIYQGKFMLEICLKNGKDREEWEMGYKGGDK